MSALQPGEQLVFQNELGVITDRRLVLGRASGRSSTQRDVPLRAIISVEHISLRHPFIAALFALMGVIAVTRGSGAWIIGVILIILGVLVYVGSHAVSVVLADGRKLEFSGKRFNAQATADFANALREELFKTSPPANQASPRWG